MILRDIVNNILILTCIIEGQYETSTYDIVENGLSWRDRKIHISSESAEKYHNQKKKEISELGVNHPCECGALNTKYSILAGEYLCPSCWQRRYDHLL